MERFFTDKTCRASAVASVVPPRVARSGILFSIVTILCFAAVERTAGQTADERFLDALRKRGLFQLAERFCRDRLAREDLSDKARAELTIELSRSLADEALQASPDERERVWRDALAAADEFTKRFSRDPRIVQLSAQRGLVQLAWGELLSQEAQLSANQTAKMDDAREHLRGHRRSASVGRQDSGHAAQPETRRRPGADELTGEELQSLEENARYQLARALRSQGEGYPAESPDRINSLSQAVELLNPLAQLDSSDPLAWPSRLDAAMCYRLLGHADAATRRLDQVDSQSPPPQIALRARAERIRLALAGGDIERATALAERGARSAARRRPTWTMPRLKHM